VQIYCDFSGYTDIAIGCARIMGIRLMKNFDHPYSATTIKEFWARWHISLSSWFRDYLYIPLGGSRCSRPRHLLNLFIVFIVSGLWHGANWTFIVWGALHGVYQIVGNLTAKPRARLIEKTGHTSKSPIVVWPRRILTFILVCFAWIFFRANSMKDALVILKNLFSFSGGGIGETLSAMGVDLTTALLMITSVVLLFLIDRMLTYDDSADGSDVLTARGGFVYFVWIILLSWALLLSKDMISTFIYFQF
jgi:D-alanyl-lipoteichoic acid acyltransferase DltB (MBOAT superfamily)